MSSSSDEINWGPPSLKEIKKYFKRPKDRKIQRRKTVDPILKNYKTPTEIEGVQETKLIQGMEQKCNVSSSYFTPNETNTIESHKVNLDVSNYLTAFEDSKIISETGFSDTLCNIVKTARTRPTQVDIRNINSSILNDDSHLADVSAGSIENESVLLTSTNSEQFNSFKEEEIIIISDDDYDCDEGLILPDATQKAKFHIKQEKISLSNRGLDKNQTDSEHCISDENYKTPTETREIQETKLIRDMKQKCNVSTSYFTPDETDTMKPYKVNLDVSNYLTAFEDSKIISEIAFSDTLCNFVKAARTRPTQVDIRNINPSILNDDSHLADVSAGSIENESVLLTSTNSEQLNSSKEDIIIISDDDNCDVGLILPDVTQNTTFHIKQEKISPSNSSLDKNQTDDSEDYVSSDSHHSKDTQNEILNTTPTSIEEDDTPLNDTLEEIERMLRLANNISLNKPAVCSNYLTDEIVEDNAREICSTSNFQVPVSNVIISTSKEKTLKNANKVSLNESAECSSYLTDEIIEDNAKEIYSTCKLQIPVNNVIISPSKAKTPKNVSVPCNSKLRKSGIPKKLTTPIPKFVKEKVYATTSKIPSSKECFKVPHTPSNKSIRTNLFSKNIKSPVATYIKYSPTAVLTKSAIPTALSTKSVIPTPLRNIKPPCIRKTSTEKENRRFPDIIYKPSKQHICKKEEQIHLPDSIKKMVTKANLVRHEKKLLKAPNENIIQEKLATDSELTSNSISDSLLSDSNIDISFWTSKQPFKN